jgi:hypothetical protein
MKQRYWLRLLAAAILCAIPLTAPSQTVRLGTRVSHVPVEGGIQPALADQFLNDRFQQADTAQMERLLAELAKNPENLGINKPEDQAALKAALEKAGDQPGKMLQDPEVKRIIEEVAAGKEKKFNLRPEDRERLKDYADRLRPPSEGKPFEPTKPDGTPTKPDVSTQPNQIDPPKPSEVKPPTTSGPSAPAATPVSPPPNSPAQSPVKDRLRNFAETLADKGLSDSPAFRRMLTNLDRVKAPEAPGGSWERRLEGLEKRFAEAGTRLPTFSWPKVDFSQRGPGGRVGPDAGTSRDAMGGAGQVVLVLLTAGAVAFLAWGLLRRRSMVELRRSGHVWRLGPWPVRPEAVSTRDELVRAFEHLALLLLGPGARNHNHHEIAAGLGEVGADRRAAAERLAGLYEQARYAPPDEALPDADLAAARADLSLLAGVAAA